MAFATIYQFHPCFLSSSAAAFSPSRHTRIPHNNDNPEAAGKSTRNSSNILNFSKTSSTAFSLTQHEPSAFTSHQDQRGGSKCATYFEEICGGSCSFLAFLVLWMAFTGQVVSYEEEESGRISFNQLRLNKHRITLLPINSVVEAILELTMFLQMYECM